MLFHGASPFAPAHRRFDGTQQRWPLLPLAGGLAPIATPRLRDALSQMHLLNRCSLPNVLPTPRLFRGHVNQGRRETQAIATLLLLKSQLNWPRSAAGPWRVPFANHASDIEMPYRHRDRRVYYVMTEGPGLASSQGTACCLVPTL